ncbi:MAG: hypothetical protein HY402_02210 [Elusimicrobia bacterium]|nr:hypothetical protein [Elusimicrobiota bacterium]
MRARWMFFGLLSVLASFFATLVFIHFCAPYYPGQGLSKLSGALQVILQFLRWDRPLLLFVSGILVLSALFVSWLITFLVAPRSASRPWARESLYESMQQVEELKGRVRDLALSIQEKDQQLERLQRESPGSSGGEAPGDLQPELERLQKILDQKEDQVRELRDRLGAAGGSQTTEETGRLQAALEQEREFASTVSHELKNPLAVVSGYSSLLLKRWKNLSEEKKLSYLGILDQEMDRLSRLVNGLLELSRIEQGVAALNISRIDLQSLVRRILDPFQVKSSHLFFALEFPPQPVTLAADEDRLKQVFFNLISNAIKYTPSAGRILVRAEESPEGILVSVTNDGPLIPPEVQKNLFQKFYRIDNEVNRKVPGTGLGLSVCKAIVELHGGRIWLDPKYGEGVRFFFTLPLVAAGVPVQEANRKP